jgi:hypothetical protein
LYPIFSCCELYGYISLFKVQNLNLESEVMLNPTEVIYNTVVSLFCNEECGLIRGVAEKTI